MIESPLQAANDINAMVAAAVAGVNGLQIRWQGKGDYLTPPDGEAPWIRVTIQHAVGAQASLAGADSSQRWNETGTLIVQCFWPITQGGLDAARNLADTIRKQFRGVDSEHGVWFRNPSIREVGRDLHWEQVNCSINFTYDTVQ